MDHTWCFNGFYRPVSVCVHGTAGLLRQRLATAFRQQPGRPRFSMAAPLLI